MELIPHSLTPEINRATFGVWLGLVSSRPLAHPELYLRQATLEAAPRCISEKTSYRRVRLAFDLYPQLISSLCNANEFDPSRSVTFSAVWPWVAHTVSGLIRATLEQEISRAPPRPLISLKLCSPP